MEKVVDESEASEASPEARRSSQGYRSSMDAGMDENPTRYAFPIEAQAQAVFQWSQQLGFGSLPRRIGSNKAQLHCSFLYTLLPYILLIT